MRSKPIESIWRSHIALYAVLGAILLLCSGCSTDTTNDPFVFKEGYNKNISTVVGPVSGSRQNVDDYFAPDFRWKNSNGALDSLSGQQGKYVLLNFFAKWCGPCGAEAPYFQSFWNKHKDSVVVIGVGTDADGDVFQRVSDFTTQYGWTFQVVVDSVYRIYNPWVFNVNGFDLPYTLVIGPDGSVLLYHKGVFHNEDELEKLLLLAEQ